MRARSTRRGLAGLAVAALSAAALLVAVGPTATAKGEPGGTLSAGGDIVDNKGTVIAGFELFAEESMDAAGVGNMFFSLGGDSISACDAHGPGAEPGTTPLAEVECGGTGNVSVVVDDCTAILETHGIVHADHPYTVYLGPMTVDIRFDHDPSKQESKVTVEIYTPKDVIKVVGTSVGPVEMDTCPGAEPPPPPPLPEGVFDDPAAFDEAIAGLGASTVVDFDDIDASPVNNTYVGREPFDGTTYASQGITFSNPNAFDLYIAPGGLFWNESNSLSVFQFPYDDAADPETTDDDLVVELDPPATAVGFTLVDNDSQDPEEFIQFIDADGNVVAEVGMPGNFSEFRAFIGIVSEDSPIAMINVVENGPDGDDVNYDDFVFVPSA
jgi:hypothetical protein